MPNEDGNLSADDVKRARAILLVGLELPSEWDRFPAPYGLLALLVDAVQRLTAAVEALGDGASRLPTTSDSSKGDGTSRGRRGSACGI